jgi:hypothetical protein
MHFRISVDHAPVRDPSNPCETSPPLDCTGRTQIPFTINALST